MGRVLMCGEGGSNLELYRASLEEEGHAVVVLQETDSGIAALEDRTFDLVLADLTSPGESGVETVTRLREAGAGEVLAVVGERPDSGESDRLREAGAGDILVRPFSMTRLALSVSQALERVELRRELEAGEGGDEAPDVQAEAEEPVPPPAIPAPGAAGKPRAAAPRPDDPGIAELHAELEAARRRAKAAELERARVEGIEAKVESLKGLVRKKEAEIARLREDLSGALDTEAELRRRGEERERALREELERLEAGSRQEFERLASLRTSELEEVRRMFSSVAEDERRSRDALHAEVQAALGEFARASEVHRQQIEILSRDGTSVRTAYEERIRTLGGEIEVLERRVADLEREREGLQASAQDDASAFKALRTSLEEAQREAEKAAKARDDLQKKIENEVRKRFNEVRVLVQERKKLLDEKHELATGSARSIEEERTRRKQLELELEELKTTLPTERKKIHALVEYQRSLIENVLAGILTVDTSGVVTLGNEPAARLLGSNLSELLGSHVDASPGFAALRPVFAEAMASGRAGPTEVGLPDGSRVRAIGTKVPFGPRELVLLSIASLESGGGTVLPPAPASSDEGPLARLGAAVAGNITDVQDFAVEIRGYLERLYGKTDPDSPARDEANGALRKVGELIDFLRDIIEQAESYLS